MIVSLWIRGASASRWTRVAIDAPVVVAARGLVVVLVEWAISLDLGPISGPISLNLGPDLLAIARDGRDGRVRLLEGLVDRSIERGDVEAVVVDQSDTVARELAGKVGSCAGAVGPLGVAGGGRCVEIPHDLW